MGEGGVNLIFPLVAAVEYVYLNQRAIVDAYQLVAGFQFDVFAIGSDAPPKLRTAAQSAHRHGLSPWYCVPTAMMRSGDLLSAIPLAMVKR